MRVKCDEWLQLLEPSFMCCGCVFCNASSFLGCRWMQDPVCLSVVNELDGRVDGV